MSLADELRTVVRGDVDDSSETREKFSRDASLFVLKPTVVVAPRDTADVQALVDFVNTKRDAGEEISITARSAGTDMSGGPLSDSIVIDMLPHFNTVCEVGEDADGGYAVVEPGVFYRDFDVRTREKGFILPSYTASRELCTVGGMAANDSGGERNLKYGKTARYVEELEMVLADGNVYTLKALSGEALMKKMSEDSFEGEMYRRIGSLVKENSDIIKEKKPHVEKNSSGYALWDIGDGITSLNLARLMVGSQGTMGIITKIKFRLVEPKPYAAMAVLFVDSIDDLGTLVPTVLAHKPNSFESYDDNTFSLAVRYFPEFALSMKSNIFQLGISFLPEIWRLLTGGVPKLVLLVEFRAQEQAEALKQAEALIAEVKMEHGDAVDTFLAKNEKEARKYWTVRRESFNLLRSKVRNKRTAPFIDDFVVPPQSLPEFLPKLNAILKEYDLIYTIAGHVGDGNFHIIPLLDPNRPDAKKLITELSDRVYELVLSYKGSISGEHNDGFVRTPYVERMFGPRMTELFNRVEETFDPQDIFNPGKKVIRGDYEPFAHLDFK
ncbi:MAG: FAD-binding oxidoreductase [Patescibacteria group bacterium UBA2163]